VVIPGPFFDFCQFFCPFAASGDNSCREATTLPYEDLAMNAICKLGLSGILVAMLWTVTGSGNHAQAQRWEGRNALGGTTLFTRNSNGTWTARSTSVYQFAEVEATADCIMLYDASREASVALYRDRMMLRNNLNGEWLEL
jgi:hypothetical protein